MINFKHIEINIGKACNNKCRFCMSSKSELWDIKFVSFDILKEKIKGYANSGYNSIGFLGGDISIHPKILEIISYCKENGFININVISNGMKFDNLEFTKKIVEAGLTRINFSIHSHIDEIEDYLIQVKGGLQRKLKALDNFKIFYNNGLLRDDLSINIVLNSKNYKKIVETMLFFYLKKSIKDIRINFMWLNDDTKENWEDLKLSYTDFFPYLKQIIYISLKYNIRVTFDSVPACIFYKIDNINYKSLIKKFLGEELDYITEIDHINSNDQFNWKERKKDLLKMQFEKCEKCDFALVCQGIRKNYGLIYGGDEFTPIITKPEKNIEENIYGQLLEKTIDLKYYYNEIEKGNYKLIEKEIELLYLKNNLDQKIANIYSLILSKDNKYSEANDILQNLINNIVNLTNEEKGHIYFNISVNYVNIKDYKEAGKYLELASNYIGNEDNFKLYYEDFLLNNKIYNIDDFKEKIENHFKNDKEFMNKYIYIDNLLNNLNKKWKE